MRRHYPDQVHGSLALARQTLSVAQRRFGSPNSFKTKAVCGQRQARAAKEISGAGLPENFSSAKLFP
jgi:hypothetical protein